MAYLTALSTELLLLVCSHLSTTDKANVSRVCKRFQQTAEPSLYADIHLRRWRFPIPNTPLHRLLASAVTAPALASHVKHFHIVSAWNINIWYGSRRTWLSDEDFEKIFTLARSAATTGEEEQWAEDAEDGNIDLFQALLISQFPNVTQLTIGIDGYSHFQYVSKMFERVLCSKKTLNGLSRFHHLKRVDICVDMATRTLETLNVFNYNLTHLLPFFYLPSVRNLRIVMPNYTKDFQWPTTQPCTKSLTSLSFKGSDVSGASLARIMTVTPNLKSFDYSFICSTRFGNPPRYLCVDGLQKALAHVKTTLEQLTISVQYDPWFYTEFEEPSPSFGIRGSLSLHEHESLIRLEVPTVVLLGQSRTRNTHLAGRLPPRLLWFYLRDDMALFQTYAWRSGVVLGILREYLSHCREHNADLQTLGLKLCGTENDWGCDLQGEFRSLCEGAHLTPEVSLVRSEN